MRYGNGGGTERGLVPKARNTAAPNPTVHAAYTARNPMAESGVATNHNGVPPNATSLPSSTGPRISRDAEDGGEVGA